MLIRHVLSYLLIHVGDLEGIINAPLFLDNETNTCEIENDIIYENSTGVKKEKKCLHKQKSCCLIAAKIVTKTDLLTMFMNLTSYVWMELSMILSSRSIRKREKLASNLAMVLSKFSLPAIWSTCSSTACNTTLSTLAPLFIETHYYFTNFFHPFITLVFI